MKKVLIFAYYWPPFASSGVQRWLKFVKYLRHFGWEPIVVTPREGNSPYLDATLSVDIPENLQVIKTETAEPFGIYNLLQGKRKNEPIAQGMIGIRDSQNPYKKLAKWVRANFFIPDARVGWKDYAIEAGKSVIEKEKIDVIVTTGPPHSAHLIGLALKKQYGLPWVADLRDPWTNIYYNKSLPRTKWAAQKDKKLEDECVINANAITVTSKGTAAEFSDRNSNIYTIYNGYDDSDLSYEAPKPTEKFVLRHVGNFFPYLDSPGLWTAIAEKQKEITNFENLFELNFVGSVAPEVMNSIEKAGISHLVTATPFVPHHEAVKLMRNATALLFVLFNDAHNHALVPGKTFEYIASGSQLLCIGNPQSEVAEILAQSRQATTADYHNHILLKSEFTKLFNGWLQNNKTAVKFNLEEDSPYRRFNLTRQMADLFDNLTLKFSK
jgi:hypothetical protein